MYMICYAVPVSSFLSASIFVRKGYLVTFDSPENQTVHPCLVHVIQLTIIT